MLTIRPEGSKDYAAVHEILHVVVLGHPDYYPGFGFEPAGAHGVRAPWDVPAEAWMVLPLPAYHPEARGLVSYAAALDAVV
jgi:predicted N-acetyltransferase YhbS